MLCHGQKFGSAFISRRAFASGSSEETAANAQRLILAPSVDRALTAFATPVVFPSAPMRIRS